MDWTAHQDHVQLATFLAFVSLLFTSTYGSTFPFRLALKNGLLISIGEPTKEGWSDSTSEYAGMPLGKIRSFTPFRCLYII